MLWLRKLYKQTVSDLRFPSCDKCFCENNKQPQPLTRPDFSRDPDGRDSQVITPHHQTDRNNDKPNETSDCVKNSF